MLCWRPTEAGRIPSGGVAMAMGEGFRLLLGIHVLYSQVLLHAPKVRVLKMSAAGRH